MRVGIVEDDEKQAEFLKEELLKWQREYCEKESLDCEIFFDGEKLLTLSEETYDILFIDIELNKKDNGIEIAKRLRESQFQGEIVFLTVHKEYVFEGYEVRALDFLLKPITATKIKRCMEYTLSQKKSGYYIFKDKRTNAIKKCAYADILYFLSAMHDVEIITNDQSYKERRGVQSLSRTLPKEFVQCHRTVIVNMQHVQELRNDKDIVMDNGQRLPVSRPYWKEIKSSFIKQFSENKKRYD